LIARPFRTGRIVRAGCEGDEIMRRRGYHFLLGAGAVLIAAAVAAILILRSGPAPNAAPRPVFPGLADRVGELAWVRVSRGAAKIDFANVAGRWVVVDKDNYPAAPEKLRALFLGLATLTLVEPETADGKPRPPLDLADPATGASTLIALRGRAGNTVAEAIVGDSPRGSLPGGADAVLVRRPGEDAAVAARGSLDLPPDQLGWIDRGIIDIAQARIASVTLTGPDGAALVLRRDKPGEGFSVAGLPDAAKARPDGRLSEIAGALAGLVLDDVKPLAMMEFPPGRAASAVFAAFDGLAVTLRLVEYDGADWVAIAGSGTGAAAAESGAINDAVARWAYKIPAARAKLLRTRLGDLTEPAKGL
jgi:hypothetical protein